MSARSVNVLDDRVFHIRQNHGPFHIASGSTLPLTDTNTMFHRGSVFASQLNNGDHSDRVDYVKNSPKPPLVSWVQFSRGPMFADLLRSRFLIKD